MRLVLLLLLSGDVALSRSDPGNRNQTHLEPEGAQPRVVRSVHGSGAPHSPSRPAASRPSAPRPAAPRPAPRPAAHRPAPIPMLKPAPRPMPSAPRPVPVPSLPKPVPRPIPSPPKPAPKTAVPAPKPASKPAVLPKPAPVPAPKPLPKPVPVPAQKPAPKPVPVPVPRPVAVPVPKLGPVTLPKPNVQKPIPVPLPKPAPKPESSKPAAKPESKPSFSILKPDLNFPHPGTKPAPKPLPLLNLGTKSYSKPSIDVRTSKTVDNLAGTKTINVEADKKLGQGTLSGAGSLTVDKNGRSQSANGEAKYKVPLGPNAEGSVGVEKNMGQKPIYGGKIDWQKELDKNTKINLGAEHKTDLKNGQTSIYGGFTRENVGPGSLSGSGTATIDNHKNTNLKGDLNYKVPLGPNTDGNIGMRGETGHKPIYGIGANWEKDINDNTKRKAGIGHETDFRNGNTNVNMGLEKQIGPGTLGARVGAAVDNHGQTNAEGMLEYKVQF